MRAGAHIDDIDPLQDDADNYVSHYACADDALCKQEAEAIMRRHFSHALRTDAVQGKLERTILTVAAADVGGFLGAIHTCQWILRHMSPDDENAQPELSYACHWIVTQAEGAIAEAKPVSYDN
ncbi:MAG: hypothetical protein EOO38_06400 [Cytophagaceae bacterium]|nr:MAG: hypothetical protein EOO38_06400 [Cytophagaceae bacterium]